MIRLGSGVSRRPIACLCLALLAVQTGCYSFLPVQEMAPATGEVVGVVLNDRGRQLVGDRMGELVERVDGSLVSATETAITLSVTRTRSLRGTHAIWAGEQVEIQREGIRGFHERQFSRGRTVLLTIGVIAGVAALISVLTLVVGGNGRPGGGGACPPDCNQQ